MALANASGCTICHQVDKKASDLGRKEVAEHYRGDDTALEAIVLKVKHGDIYPDTWGNWGQIPMAPQPLIRDETIRQLVAWILSL